MCHFEDFLFLNQIYFLLNKILIFLKNIIKYILLKKFNYLISFLYVILYIVKK